MMLCYLGEIERFNTNLHLCCLLTYGCLTYVLQERLESYAKDFSQDLRENYYLETELKIVKKIRTLSPSYIREYLKMEYSSIFEGFLKPPKTITLRRFGVDSNWQLKLLKDGQTLYLI